MTEGRAGRKRSPEPGSAPGAGLGRERNRVFPSAAETGAPRSGKDDSPLGRYVRILESVAPSRAGLTLTGIAHESGLQAGTVHRLLRGLLDLGLLRARAGSKSYVPGPRLKNLLHLTMDMAEYSDLAQSTLGRLVDEFGETAHLARLNGDCAESVLMKQPLGSDRAFVQPGRRLPLHAAASGKALLAFQDEAFVSRYLSGTRVRYTERTKVGAAEIRREMERIREDGMAVCENELDAGVAELRASRSRRRRSCPVLHRHHRSGGPVPPRGPDEDQGEAVRGRRRAEPEPRARGMSARMAHSETRSAIMLTDLLT